MKIKAILPYFGGKRTLSPQIVTEIGEHNAYWELFCGSLAVLLAKPACRAETVNDLHGDVTNLARVIAGDRYEELSARLKRTAFCETLFHEVRGILQERSYADELERAYCFFVESWMGRNGVAGTRASNTAFCVRYTSNGGDPAARFMGAVDSIDDWHDRLRGVLILERDAFELAERIEDKAGTVIYADPPYVKKGGEYVHDFTLDDHRRLAELLGRFNKTRVIVSYYEHSMLDDLYADWTKRNLDATKAMVNQGMRDSGGAVKAPEILLINGPSYIESKGLFT